jgi:tetratricopeptide (TPR) repeat protein
VGAASNGPSDGLIQKPPEAAQLLSFLGVLAPDPVPLRLLRDHAELLPEQLAKTFSSRRKEEACLRALEGPGLVEQRDDAVTVSEETRDKAGRATPSPKRTEYRAAAIELLRAAFPEEADDHREWEACEVLLPHLLAVTDEVEALRLGNAACAWLLDRAALYLHSKGEFAKAMELSTQALASARLSEDDPLLGTLYRTRASLLSEFGEVPEARSEVERALSVHMPLGEDDVQVRADRVILADVLSESGESKAALEQLDLALGERDLAEADRWDCAAWRTRGWVFWDTGRLEEGRDAYQKALELTERVQGETHLDTVNALTGLGGVLGSLGNLEEARAELERALEVVEASVDPNHPEVAVIRSNLGGVLHSLGKLDEACIQLELALDAGEELLPGDHRGIWIRHRKLASILYGLARHEEARVHAEEALAISERASHASDSRLEDDLKMLAPILRALGDQRAAHQTYLRAREIAVRRHEEGHVEVAGYDLQIGQILRQLGDLPASRRHLEQALQVYEGESDRSSSALLVRLELAQLLVELGNEVSRVAVTLGKDTEAEEMRATIAATFDDTLEKELGEADPRTMTLVAEASIAAAPERAARILEKAAVAVVDADADLQPGLRQGIGLTWHRLARSLQVSRSYEQAVDAFEASLAMFPDSLQSQGMILHDIAGVRVEQGKLAEAIEVYREAVGRKREADDEDKRRDLAVTLQALGRTLTDSGLAEEALKVFEEELELLRSQPHPDLYLEGATLHEIAELLRKGGDAEAAVGRYREALARRRSLGGSRSHWELGATLVWLGRTLATRGEYDEAVALYREWLETLRSLPDSHPQPEGAVLHDIANARRAQGELAEAVELFQEAADRKREGPDRRDLAITLNSLGRTLGRMREYENALAVYQEQLEILRGLPTRDFNFEGVALQDRAEVLLAQGRFDEAVELYREAIRTKREAGAKTDLRSLIATQQALGRALLRTRDFEAAVDAYQEQLKTLRELPQPDPQVEGVALHDIADVRQAQGAVEEAIVLYRQAAERKAAAEKVSPTSLAITHQALGRALQEQESYDGALAEYGESLRLIRELPQPEPGFEAVNVHDTGDIRMTRGEFEEAKSLYEEAAELNRKAGEARGEALSLQALGRVFEQQGEYPAALRIYRESLDIFRAQPTLDLQSEGVVLNDIADVHRAEERLEEAVAVYREVVERFDEVAVEDSSEMAAALIKLGSAEISLERSDARPVATLKRAVEILRSEPKPDKSLLFAALGYLGESTLKTEPEEAVKHLTEAVRVLDEGVFLDDLQKAAVRTNLALATERVGRKEEAEEQRGVALDIFERAGAAGLPPGADLRAFYSFCLEKDHPKLADAVLAHVRAEAEKADQGAPVHRTLADMLGLLGRDLELRRKQLSRALTAYEEQLSLCRALLEPDPRAEGVAIHDIADVRSKQGESEEAVKLYAEALDLKRHAGERVSRVDLSRTLLALAMERLKLEGPAGAATIGDEPLELLLEEKDSPAELRVSALAAASATAEEQGDSSRAIELLREAEDLLGDPPAAYHLEASWIPSQLARLYGEKGDAAAAEAAGRREASLDEE